MKWHWMVAYLRGNDGMMKPVNMRPCWKPKRSQVFAVENGYSKVIMYLLIEQS